MIAITEEFNKEWYSWTELPDEIKDDVIADLSALVQDSLNHLAKDCQENDKTYTKDEIEAFLLGKIDAYAKVNGIKDLQEYYHLNLKFE